MLKIALNSHCSCNPHCFFFTESLGLVCIICCSSLYLRKVSYCCFFISHDALCSGQPLGIGFMSSIVIDEVVCSCYAIISGIDSKCWCVSFLHASFPRLFCIRSGIRPINRAFSTGFPYDVVTVHYGAL